MIKKHAAKTNAELGLLNRRVASAIQKAAQEVADGKQRHSQGTASIPLPARG